MKHLLIITAVAIIVWLLIRLRRYLRCRALGHSLRETTYAEWSRHSRRHRYCRSYWICDRCHHRFDAQFRRVP